MKDEVGLRVAAAVVQEWLSGIDEPARSRVFRICADPGEASPEDAAFVHQFRPALDELWTKYFGQDGPNIGQYLAFGKN